VGRPSDIGAGFYGAGSEETASSTKRRIGAVFRASADREAGARRAPARSNFRRMRGLTFKRAGEKQNRATRFRYRAIQ